MLQTLYTLSDGQTEYQIRARLSFMRVLSLALHDAIPDAKTIWLFCEQLTRAGAFERLFARFDALLRDAGYLAMGGQIVDATVVQARRPRLRNDEKAIVKGRRRARRLVQARADGHRRSLDPQARPQANG